MIVLPFPSARILPLVFLFGLLSFIFLHAVLNSRRPHLEPLTGSLESDHSLLPWNQTLGVASRVYVLSLPRRSDRQKDMEHLRKTLGLQWTYVEAIGTHNAMIKRIMDSVRSIREKNFYERPFLWPDVLPPLSERIDLWSPEFLVETDPSTHSIEKPMLCATKNNTVRSYKPNLPTHLILTPARVACWLSHMSIIQTIANDDALKAEDAAIVFEDDINMERDIGQRLEHLWPFLPRDWDIVYLGHCWSNESFYPALNTHENFTAISNTASVSHIHPSKSPLCTHAYAVSRTGARRILLHMRYPAFAYSRAVDRAMAWLIQSRRLKSFSIVPSIVVQRKVGKSDIMPEKGSKWKDDLFDGVYDN
ncbi:Lsg locus putative protein 4 [Hypsizygus marmoreus]|uniref:Glycosyl transferase family 25 domain-containing protein n=1 Tax=Hypsizygus marmoreus TaxID=39966 RepID=A0A369K5Z1_HYPMA|nr:Lsg locus putative protein 4 [Hypsizygus marmoreus]